MILLFTRLGDLFESKAAARGLVVYMDRERKIYSEKLELWCRKLDDLNPENFKTGIAGLERKAEIDYREGNEMWPPSYAEFRALAFPKTGRETQAHKYFPPVPALEDQTAKAKRYELGRNESAKLLAMFGEDPVKPACSNEFARQRLAQARELVGRND